MPTRVYYGWFVAAATFVTLVTTAGILTAPTMFMQPMEKEFGWTADTISVSIGIQIALFGLTGPFAAAWARVRSRSRSARRSLPAGSRRAAAW